jgi:adenylate kinase
MGDLLRTIAASATERGNRVRAYLDRGDLVPDELVNDVVRDALARIGARGYVLDGYPRTAAQARALDAVAPPDAAISLVVPDEVARLRIAGRAGAGEGRTDDENRAAVDRRLGHFHRQVEPILDYYGDGGRLRTVDADRPAGVVTAAIEAALAGSPTAT